MNAIQKSDCTLIADNTLEIDASDAGLRPGEWPDTITILREDGVGILVWASKVVEVDGAAAGMWYHTLPGPERATHLFVMND